MMESDTYYDPLILLPNRVILGVVNASCPCGASFPVRDGILGTHFPPLHNGAALRDPFFPGTSTCRNSGRTVTVEAAQRRDESQTGSESLIAGRVRMNPHAWLGVLDWVAFDDVAIGERVGFTQVDRPGPYEPETVVEREGTVLRRGKTFAVIACDGGGQVGEVRLTAKDWSASRVRKKDGNDK